jgi:hypothetical protein
MKSFSKKMPSTKGALQTNPPRHEKPLSPPGGELVKGTLKLFNYEFKTNGNNHLNIRLGGLKKKL